MKGGNQVIIDENNFIGQIKDHNEDALKYIIDKYGGLVKSVVSKTLYAYPQDIEESVLDTFMKVWQNIKYFDESKNTFKNWIAAIAKYRAIDKLRQIRKSEIITGIEDDKLENISEISDDTAFNDAIEELLSCLNKSDKELFIKLYIQGLTIEEISKETGKSKALIYNHISRGKKKIICANPSVIKRSDKNG